MVRTYELEWKINLSNIMTMVLAAALGALLSWVVRLDDRVFALNANAATKNDVKTLEYRIDSKLDSIIGKVDKLQSEFDRNFGRQQDGRP